MVKITRHLLNKLIAGLILAGFISSILFGQGTHVHSFFDHIFDHGDIHFYVHVHDQLSNHANEDSAGYDLEDSHNHPISTLSLKSTRIVSSQQNVMKLTQSFISVVSESSKTIVDDLLPAYLGLPPPDQSSKLYHFYSFSLRAPPVG